MKTYFLYTIIILFFGSCNSREKPKDTIMDSYNARVQFYFYPSSGGDAIYEVDYNEGYVKVENNEVSNGIFRKSLKNEENVKVAELTDKIKIVLDTTTEIILDSWRIELKISGTVHYNKSGVKINDLPPEIKDLLYYLLTDSTVKIDLFDFS